MLPDGIKRAALVKNTTSGLGESESNWTLQEAKRTRSFWLLLFCTAVPAMVNTGLIFHLVSILAENNISSQTAALVISLMAVLSFPISFFSGFLNERVPSRLILVYLSIGQLVAVFVLLHTNSVFMAILFGCLRGILGGFESITLNVIWPQYFGRTHIGSIKGMAMTITVIASAFGPLPFGFAFDWFRGYNEILWVMMIFPLLAATAAHFSTQPLK